MRPPQSFGSKVLITYSPTLDVCGIGSFTRTLYGQLERKGWVATVALAWGQVFNDPRRFEALNAGIRTVRMDGRTGSEEGRIKAIARAIEKVNPSLVIHNNLNSGFEAVRRLRSKGMFFPLVVLNHGALPEHAACLLANQDVIDHVVCVNRLSSLVMSSVADGFPPERIHYIPNAVPGPTSASKRSTNQIKRVGYAGRLVEDKGFQDIFPFFRSLAKLDSFIELWVAGEGPLAAELKALGEEFPGRVKYLGNVTGDTLYRDFYPAIDILIHFSSSEGWSLTMGEAMANGVVPVTSAFRGVYTEALLREGYNALLFPIGDSDSASRIVFELLRNEEKLNEMSRRASEVILTEFTLEHFGDNWSSELSRFVEDYSTSRQSQKQNIYIKKSNRESYKEMARQLLRRRFHHQFATEEWPTYQSIDKQVVIKVEEKMNELEQKNLLSVGINQACPERMIQAVNV